MNPESDGVGFLDGPIALLDESTPVVCVATDSPILDNMLEHVRTRCGNELIPKGGSGKRIMELLGKNQLIGILSDQNVAVREGVFVDFFGRPACATTGVALMAMHTGAAVLPVFTTRMQNGTYLTEIGPQVETVKTGNRDKDLLTNTQSYNKIIEDHVRKYPGQWLWLHRRWKTRPVQARKHTHFSQAARPAREAGRRTGGVN